MSTLVNGIKAEAEGEDDTDLQKRLLAAAKNLADATAKMVEAAKVCFWGRRNFSLSRKLATLRFACAINTL